MLVSQLISAVKQQNILFQSYEQHFFNYLCIYVYTHTLLHMFLRLYQTIDHEF